MSIKICVFCLLFINILFYFGKICIKRGLGEIPQTSLSVCDSIISRNKYLFNAYYFPYFCDTICIIYYIYTNLHFGKVASQQSAQLFDIGATA